MKIIKQNKTLIRNIFFLGFSQLINFASPVLITPYLLKTIGIENFGVVAMGQTLMNIFTIFTEYGFNLTSTQAASVNRNDIQSLGKLYNNVITARFILLIIGFFILLVIVHIVPKFYEHRIFLLLSYSIVLGRSLIPVWLFVGIERASVVAYINAFSRLITYIMVFVFVRNKSDYEYINVLWASGEIVLGAFTIHHLKSKYGIKTQFIFSKSNLGKEFKDGFPVFLTNISNAIYMNSGLIILSVFSSDRSTGMYAVAEKIMLLMKQIFGVVSQATYPHVCRLVQKKTKELNDFLVLELFGCAIVFAVLGGGTYFFADELVFFFSNTYSETTISLLRQLSFVPLIVSICLPAYQILIANNYKKSYLTIIGMGAMLNVALSFAIVPKYHAQGTVYVIIFTEVFVTAGLHIMLAYKHPKEKISFSQSF